MLHGLQREPERSAAAVAEARRVSA
jgi:hypothetical protein